MCGRIKRIYALISRFFAAIRCAAAAIRCFFDENRMKMLSPLDKIHMMYYNKDSKDLLSLKIRNGGFYNE